MDIRRRFAVEGSLEGSGSAVLEIETAVLGHAQKIYPALFWGSGTAALVDTAYPGKEGELLEGARLVLGSTDSLTALLITHQDIDHIGGGEGFIASLGRDLPVYAHALDAPYIRGERLLLKLSDMGKASGFKPEIPPGTPESKVKALFAALANPPRLRVTNEIEGEGRLDLAGRILAMPTPGHTPGHLSFYHEASGTLVAGDALVSESGRLRLPPPEFCADRALAIESAKSLVGCCAKRIVCYHGGIVEEDVRRQLLDMAGEAERMLSRLP